MERESVKRSRLRLSLLFSLVASLALSVGLFFGGVAYGGSGGDGGGGPNGYHSHYVCIDPKKGGMQILPIHSPQITSPDENPAPVVLHVSPCKPDEVLGQLAINHEQANGKGEAYP